VIASDTGTCHRDVIACDTGTFHRDVIASEPVIRGRDMALRSESDPSRGSHAPAGPM
jgi:hypothetical protein